MTAIADGMKRRRRFSQMLSYDARITDLLVAERKLVMGQADRA
jgi:hypothetical protein